MHVSCRVAKGAVRSGVGDTLLANKALTYLASKRHVTSHGECMATGSPQPEAGMTSLIAPNMPPSF